MDAFASDGIRQRLNQLCDHINQAEIARKVGTTRNNVSRYLRGTRVPIEFGAALVKNAGVNPAWLLTGEGAPFLSDIAAGAGETASNIVELVQAMTNISKMRLGALTGKAHAKMVNELNTALGAYETVRKQLNERVTATYRELLVEFDAAVNASELKRADFLKTALDQVSRLCDDDELDSRLVAVSAAYEFKKLRFERAMDLQRESFTRALRKGTRVTEADCLDACNFAHVLFKNGLMGESRAVCRAMLALTGRRGKEWQVRRLLSMLTGWLDIESGSLHRGAARIGQAFSGMTQHYQDQYRGIPLRAQLYLGLQNFDEILERARTGGRVAPTIVQFACWTERPEQVKRACDQYVLGKQAVIGPETQNYARAKYLYQALFEPSKNIIDPFIESFKAIPDNPGTGKRASINTFIMEVTATQLARIAGDERRATDHLKASDECFGAMDPEESPPLLVRATHYRNVVAIAEKLSRSAYSTALLQKARRFFRRAQKRGYVFDSYSVRA
ncbi:MAG: helix-turn-helix domain-containing protein [Planctomycetes bacterium]|nr:helix-turn-helix domain-containing protein [Planctomycetota bacterium]NUQ33550.1 helix-turn-helix transcriptional regulator [Planctomycetaceae bacterium]